MFLKQQTYKLSKNGNAILITISIRIHYHLIITKDDVKNALDHYIFLSMNVRMKLRIEFQYSFMQSIIYTRENINIPISIKTFSHRMPNHE